MSPQEEKDEYRKIVQAISPLVGDAGVSIEVFADLDTKAEEMLAQGEELAAIGLILIMLGAIQKKIFVWRTGFCGKSGTNGWSYDMMLVVMNLVIVTIGGGNLSLTKWFE